MKTAAIFAALGLIAAAGSAAAQTGIVAIPSGTNTLMFTAFRRWCLDVPPNFDALDGRATSAHLRVSGDNKVTQPDGSKVETKTWFYATGPANYAISAVKAVQGGQTMSACNVYSGSLADANMVDFLSQETQFGKPLQQSTNGDRTLWNGPFPNTAIRLDLRNS